MTAITRRPPRLPATVFTGATGVLFILVAVVALTARAASPPSVAELAPQAVDKITQEQSGDQAGEGVGGESGAATGGETSQAGDTPTGAALDDEIPEADAVHRCVGNPPRQIEDPQSPPCVPIWKGDNGGSTWHKGVTGSEIKVAIAVMNDTTTGQPLLDSRAIKMFERFFNRRFEFYGRQLNLEPFAAAPPAAKAPQMVADAEHVANSMKAFAATMYGEQGGNQKVFFDALADRQVMGIQAGTFSMTRATEADYRARAPFQWDYVMSADRLMRSQGQWICAQLAGKPPTYAGSFPWTTTRPEKRTFGVVVSSELGPAFDVDPLKETLAGCGEELKVIPYDGSSQAAVLIASLVDQRITDVLFTGEAAVLSVRFMPAASSQRYFPEWLVWHLGYQDSESAPMYYGVDHRDHVLGLHAFNKTLRLEDHPHMWALREIDPGMANEFASEPYMKLYQALLVLASGIQAAGPNLTPYTFESNLMRTRFPNPGAGQAPYYQARVGFPGVHSMVQDVTPVWLNNRERPMWGGSPPAYCYVDLGLRYGLGEWKPREPAFHQDARGPCR